MKHYHAWLMASTGTILYRIARAFGTRQGAHKYARRRQPDAGRRTVLECRDEGCRWREDAPGV